jgi:molybdopterin-guanine dinucleotide biosynthesis protein A
MLLSIVVQAGGESLRMGTNKALLPFLGVPLIERVVERVRHLAAEVLITTNQPAGFEYLHLPLIPDPIPGQGALVGLHTALQVASQPYVAVVACDMPFVKSQLISYQLDRLVGEQVDLVIPLTEQGYEPFHAVYRRETCLSAVDAALQSGKKRMISWFDQVRVRELGQADLQRFDPLGRAFLNINTPEEFQIAEQMAQAGEF